MSQKNTNKLRIITPNIELNGLETTTPNLQPFKNVFKRTGGKNWSAASRDEKEKFVINKVTALWDKWNKAQKPVRINPFVPEDFKLTEEEFELLPHNWFKGLYLTLKIGFARNPSNPIISEFNTL